MKKQKEIINDLIIYRDVFLKSAKEQRKKYYLENRTFYRDLRFDEFLNDRSKLHLIEEILGVEKTKIEIVIIGECI